MTKTISRRHVWRALALAGALSWAAMPAAAQDYPDKPIRLVVPFGAGSGSDNVARMLAERVSAANPRWQFIIENKAGASGIIGAQEARRAPADGYTLFYTGNTTHGANSALFKSLPYDPLGDFVPITRVGVFPLALLVRPDLPVRSVGELVELARQKPGVLTFASASAGPRVAAETLKHRGKLDVRHVPYKSSPQALTDLIGGHVDFLFIDTVAAMPLIRDGKLKALAVAAPRRIEGLPDLPTMAEAGFPDFEMSNWSAVFARTGTPPAVMQTIHEVVSGTIASPEWQKYVAGLGAYADVLDPGQTRAFVEREIEHYRATLGAAGVVPE